MHRLYSKMQAWHLLLGTRGKLKREAARGRYQTGCKLRMKMPDVTITWLPENREKRIGLLWFTWVKCSCVDKLASQVTSGGISIPFSLPTSPKISKGRESQHFLPLVKEIYILDAHQIRSWTRELRRRGTRRSPGWTLGGRGWRRGCC